jgi:16S rRNA (uracil1498-N3)-methyltransferase
VKHIPHLVVSAPWEEGRLALSVVQWRHVTKVLRMKSGDQVTYTDGLGKLGEGVLRHQLVERGEEREVGRPSTLTVAVAPPANRDRQRFLVEKLAEIGIARLIWLETAHGKNRVANPEKVFSWVHAAVEQSRGAYLMETSEEMVKPTELGGDLVVCVPGGRDGPGTADVVAIGPEGGFAEDELPASARRWDLGANVLRVETAAIVAAIRLGGN